MLRVLAAAALPGMLIVAAPAHADTYTRANFSAGIFGGNANARDPLRDPFFPSDVFAGSFVFNNNLVPAPGSGFVNVGFGSFPDIANIPAGDAFTFNFGPYVFTLANDPAAQIQYNNGQFNGFVFNTTFVFEGTTYLFKLSGGSLQVNSQADPFGQPFINGYVNIGNQAVTGGTPYTPRVTPPQGAVPEPATWAMMILGFGAVGFAMRRRRTTVTVRFA